MIKYKIDLLNLQNNCQLANTTKSSTITTVSS